ncbi:MAG: TonB-dependent receptor [Caulobacter sp.]|nr:TonB-dependent receptor [Caulobacter sp.]
MTIGRHQAGARARSPVLAAGVSGLALLLAHGAQARPDEGPRPVTPLSPVLVEAGQAADGPSLSARDFGRASGLAVTDTFLRRLPGVALSDPQGNDFAKSLNFHGFEASPLQGSPQGLAVYFNGVRLNEAFGDTVNWDLIPQIAIRRADLITDDPAFGLNALGGAVKISAKDGFGPSGTAGELRVGAFGKRQGAVETTAQHGALGVYLAADAAQDDGWRWQSPSKVARLHGDLGWRGDGAELHLTITGTANAFGLVGATPVDLLSGSRKAVYTYPQRTLNNAGLVTLTGTATRDGWTFGGSLSARRFLQKHIDGNDAEFEGCSRSATNPLFNTLCIEDDAFPAAIRPPAADFQVLTASGAPIPCPPLVAGQTKGCNGVPYGSIDRTRTKATTYAAAAEASRSDPLLGRSNSFTLGVSLERATYAFGSNSTLGLINGDLSVTTNHPIPGLGSAIQTRGAIAYSPVEVSGISRYWGLYAADRLELTPRLAANLTARLNDAAIRTTDLTGLSPDLNGDHRFRKLNPAMSLTYDLGAGLALSGGYAQSNRAPTPLELGCSNPLKPCLLENALVSDPPLKQVTARTWQAALRGDQAAAGGRLSWALNAYQADSDDDIVSLASTLAGRGYYANVAKTRRRGVDLDGRYEAARVQAYAGYSYVEATYRFEGLLASPSNPLADDDGNVAVRPGDQLGGAPNHRFKAGIEAEVLPRLILGLDAVAMGPQRFVGDVSNQNRKLPGYAVAALAARYRLDDRLTLFGRIDNLLDKSYATYGTYFETEALDSVAGHPLPDSPDPRTVTPAAPRAFTLGLRVAW